MTNSLAKAYALKSAYIVLASIINVLTVITTQNIGMLFVGLFMFLGSCISDCYFKETENKATIFFRRIGYIIPSLATIYIYSLVRFWSIYSFTL